MKFVNKLSVISLLVLMFSFMNIAQAANACTGTAVTACSKITDQSTCANYYIKYKDGTGAQCKWGSYCSNGGAACVICASDEIIKDGACFKLKF